MDFQVLGPVRAMNSGKEVPVGGPRHRRVLAVLLVHADATVSTDRLIDALWGSEPPRSVTAMLHVRMSEVRAALRAGGHDGPVSGRGGYRLPMPDDELDSREFERLATLGAAALAKGDHATARSSLITALSRWRGPAFGEFAAEPFARIEAERLEALRIQAVEDRIEADLAQGRHAAVVAELTTMVAEHPLHERFREQLMTALYRSGRPSEALDVYADAQATLADQLGADPGPSLARLHAKVLRQDPDLGLPAPPVTIATPLTSFVGRERDVDQTRTRLRTSRLVTLTGVGGAGKTRLASAVAGRDDFPDGVWFVELAPLTHHSQVVPAVATALRVREQPRRELVDTLTDRLRDSEALLVLDNCEHVIEEAARLADRLLRACPRLRILATSRERLTTPGEQVCRISGLETPDAVRLLIERAAAVRPGFAPRAGAITAIEQICRRLDGIPLAIELAAVAVAALGPERTAIRLDDRFAVLTHGSRTSGPRHRTLRAVVDWSYDLLDAPGQRLFDRLGVFVGSFTVEAAEAVCAVEGDPPVATTLTALVDKSLVVFEDDRHRLLETLRAYAVGHLAETEVRDGLRDRHAAHTLQLVSDARRALHGPDEPAWLDRLENEIGNIRAALDWSIERGDAGTAVRLAGSLYLLWDRHGHYSEGSEWLTRALALKAELPPLVRARALGGLARLAVLQGDLAAGAAAAEEAAGLSQAAGDSAGVARVLATIGLAELYAGDTVRAEVVLRESLRHARAAGDRAQAGSALLHLGAAALAHRTWAEALRLSDQSEQALRTLADVEGLAFVQAVRCAAATRLGDWPTAAAALTAARRGFEELDHRWGLALCLHLEAEAAAAVGDHRGAVWLAASSQALRESVAAAPVPFLDSWLESLVMQCRKVLGNEDFAAVWQAGTVGAPIDDDGGGRASLRRTAGPFTRITKRRLIRHVD